MSQSKKKASLFKQKIAEARSKMENKESGFPVAPSILQHTTAQKQYLPPPIQSITQTIKAHSFLSNFRGDKYVKPEELSKIETENWQKIESMPQNERQGIIAQLKSQLPQSFIKRLNIKKEEPKSQSQNLQKLIDDKLNSTTSNHQMNEYEQKVEETWRQLLKLNIETKSLEYTTKTDDKYVNLQKLAFLVGNQMNHSQLVGGKLISMWSKAISQKLTAKTRQLITINGVTLHGSYLGDKIGSIIEVCLRQVKNTTYSGIFLQLCSFVSQAIVYIASLLNAESKKRLALQLESILQKMRTKKTVSITVQQANQIKESIDTIKDLLKTSEQEQTLNWKNLIASIDSIIELIVLQEAGFKGYWQKAYKTAQKCSDLDELIELLEFIYQLVNKLIIKRNKQLYIDLKIHRERWAPAIDHIIIKLVKSCWKLESQHMFKAVFLSRFVGGTSWEAISEATQLPGQKGQLICGFLLFNTLTDLKIHKITEEQIYLLNLTIEWLSGVFYNKNKDFLDPNYIFQTFLQVFLLEEQYYSLLNQQALQNLVKVILTHHKLAIKDHVSIQKVRTLSQNYCFSSYGNQSFTLLMFLIAVNGSDQIEEMILREVITPYWKFFYEVGKRIEIKHIEQEKKNSNLSLKQELVNKIKEQGVKIGDNQFVAYLS